MNYLNGLSTQNKLLLGIGGAFATAAIAYWCGRQVSSSHLPQNAIPAPRSEGPIHSPHLEGQMGIRRVQEGKAEDPLSHQVQKPSAVAEKAMVHITDRKESIAASRSAISSKKEVLVVDPKYGIVEIEEFSPSWLSDFPHIVEHLESEHLLHVKGLDEKGRGLTWHTEKFSSDMDARLNPEAKLRGAARGGFQMKLAYFIIPPEKMESISSLSLTEEVSEDLKVKDPLNGKLIGYRFFIHPQAFDHFRSLHNDLSLKYVPPQESDFICTPTSSYRSLAIRRVTCDPDGTMTPAKGSLPFIVKVGVGGSVLGSDRWLSTREIRRSVQCQQAFDGMSETHFERSKRTGKAGSDLLIFPESQGFYLKDIEAYRPEKASGILIREFPTEMLEGECRIVSLAALMSPERTRPENAGLCRSGLEDMESFESIPLIFEVMEAAIRKGLAKDPMDFIQKYLIEGYINAIEAVTFQEGMTIEPHSQNLCMVLNNDFTPRGYAYRDHGGIWVDAATRGLQGKPMTHFYSEKGDGNTLFKTKGAIAKAYIGSFSWFYRYQVFIKTLNVVTELSSSIPEMMPPPKGAPFQIGGDTNLKERNLQPYLIRQLSKSNAELPALKQLRRLSITFGQYQQALELLDKYYDQAMNRYFDMEKIKIEKIDGALPAAEGGSGRDELMTRHRGFLGNYRFYSIPSNAPRFNFQEASGITRSKILENTITSFEDLAPSELNIQDCLVLKKGICLLDEQHNVIGFSPYKNASDKGWWKKQANRIHELI